MSVRLSARQLFYLINHTSLMLFRRRKALANNALSKRSEDESVAWSNYLIRRLPRDVGFKHIHVMFSPSETTIPRTSGKEGNRIFEPHVEKLNGVPARITNKGNGQSDGLALKPIPSRRISNNGSNSPSKIQGHRTVESNPQDHHHNDKHNRRFSAHRPNKSLTQSHPSHQTNSEVPSFGSQLGVDHGIERFQRRRSDLSGEVPNSHYSRMQKNIHSQDGNMNYDRHQGDSRLLEGHQASNRKKMDINHQRRYSSPECNGPNSQMPA